MNNNVVIYMPMCIHHMDKIRILTDYSHTAQMKTVDYNIIAYHTVLYKRRKIPRFSRFSVETTKNVRQLETAERHLPPKCTNFGFFTTKMYEFWFFYHQSVRILVFVMELYEYWDVT